MGQKSKVAQEAEIYLQEINGKIDHLPDTSPPKVNLSKEAIAFFNKRLIQQRPPNWGSWNNPYSKANLVAVQNILLEFTTARTDFVADSQLQIQRIMQSYNTVVTFINSLQSSLTEMVKTLIQGIR